MGTDSSFTKGINIVYETKSMINLEIVVVGESI